MVAPQKRPKELATAILYLVTGCGWLALGIRDIIRRNGLSWFSMIPAMCFIFVGALGLRTWYRPAKPAVKPPLSILRP